MWLNKKNILENTGDNPSALIEIDKAAREHCCGYAYSIVEHGEVGPVTRSDAAEGGGDAGEDVGITQDYNGNTVSVGSAPDIGPFEIQR